MTLMRFSYYQPFSLLKKWRISREDAIYMPNKDIRYVKEKIKQDAEELISNISDTINEINNQRYNT